ncbi:MAG TPA: type I-U CRISPR-associated RAMP protein Csb1/Cas7u [Candidatus Dormibacteraeota bacterium]|nr:type I-U CRISPR-associated RAMP protein Csb1/Cas7u [Candidatus Dormibacteraeota bacterium]
MRIDVDRLIEACRDDSQEAGVTVHVVQEPLAGPAAPVKPAVYAGGLFQEDERWWGDPPARTRVIVIDNVPSQANRLEAALEGLRPSLGLPEVVLDLSGVESLPSHLPRRLSGFRFPHRHADAYLRDAMLDGSPFPQTPVGAAILDATAEEPAALFQWFPQALLFGYWQSHLGKRRTQAKLARSWISEIVGYDPAPQGEWTRTLGLKGDPLNLSVDEPVTFQEDDLLRGWQGVEQGQKTGGRRQRESLSEIGHGQVPVRPQEAALAGVSFRSIEQRATVSFAGLRRVHCRDGEASAVGRALLVALGLVAHVAAFGRAFSLRSGCDLRPVRTRWRWLGANGEEELEPPSMEEAVALFEACRQRAEAVGLTEGGGWGRDPLVVTPNPSLVWAITATWQVG